MSEVQLHVDDQYLPTLLGYMKTLKYVEVSKVSTNRLIENANSGSNIKFQIEQNDPL
jgi:hypothetical protein